MDNDQSREPNFYEASVTWLRWMLEGLEKAKQLEEDRDVKIELIKAFSYIDEAKDILTGVKAHYENKH